ncbi:MAG: ABC transporter permease [Eubacteriales bacterium]|nr:ABC transporter permease [Eubacteriales bacterium]
MKKSMLKDLLREIKSSFGRFIAIFAIVAIGVSFFAGVSASSGDMKHSSDKYYDDYNMNDIRLLSSIGFKYSDIDAIRNIQGVKGVYAGHAMDVILNFQDLQVVAHMSSIPDNDRSDNNEDYINRLRIKEGRLPESDNECVIKYESMRKNVNVGDKITFSSGTSEDLSESLDNTEYTVVGIVYSPYYVSREYGSSEIGNGHVSYVVYVNESNFKEEVYSDVYVTIDGARELDTYSNKYTDSVNEVSDKIASISSERLNKRAKDIEEEFEKAKADKKKEIQQLIREDVVAQITEQYESYYPGADVSKMIEPFIEPAYNKTVSEYDFNAVNEEFNKKLEETLSNYDSWEWYEITRESQYSYKDYQNSADRMSAIATVFPLFFIIVAALVCLTTMTRMVEEQRGLIGTYKALGYGKLSIAMRYILYAFTASLTGGIIGCAVGLKLFPRIIYDAWNIIYQMPAISYDEHKILSVVSVVCLVAATLIVTFYACFNILEEVPSELMRPKSPKSGKKILLERITFIWKHISFTGKVTMRNLFLYKKRFFMTVIGIAGCTALMTAGFGIKDSVESVLDNQYKEILQYNCIMTFEKDASEEEKNDVLTQFDEDTYIDSVIKDYSEIIEAYDSDSGETYSVELAVVSDVDDYKDFVRFKTRKNHNEISLTDDGIIISEKLSKDLNVDIGDTVKVKDSDDKYIEVTISAIMEMYVNNYMFMTSDYYNTLYGEKPEYNRVLLKLTEDEGEVQNILGEKYLTKDSVKSLTFVMSNAEVFENMIESLNLVTWVLIISAGLLSFVVLYNLTNVNISERIRELATIKVLGFYNPEVGMYVYRENIILTLIGGFFGLFLGKLLHLYIMVTIEMNGVMFGDTIQISSYLLAYGITILFSLIVNAFMYPALKHIPMVESLKSVE